MSDITLGDLLSPKTFHEKYPNFKLSRIRTWIHESKPRSRANGESLANGFADCMKREGRNVLLIESKVLDWIVSGGAERRVRHG